MKMSTAQLSAKDLQALYPKIAQIVRVAEEGGGGGNPIMESMKMEHAEEKHEQEIRHKEELHSITMEEKGMALQQKQQADAMKQQEMGMEMPPEPPPPLDPEQGQGMIDAAYQNMQNREPMEGPLKEGADMQKNAYEQGFEAALVNLGVKTAASEEEMRDTFRDVNTLSSGLTGGIGGAGIGGLMSGGDAKQRVLRALLGAGIGGAAGTGLGAGLSRIEAFEPDYEDPAVADLLSDRGTAMRAGAGAGLLGGAGALGAGALLGRGLSSSSIPKAMLYGGGAGALLGASPQLGAAAGMATTPEGRGMLTTDYPEK
jgi:hypothetical protein